MHHSLYPVFPFPKTSYLSHLSLCPLYADSSQRCFSADVVLSFSLKPVWSDTSETKVAVTHLVPVLRWSISFLFFAALALEPGGLSSWRQMGYGFLLCLPKVHFCFSAQPLPVILVPFLLSDISLSLSDSRSEGSLLILQLLRVRNVFTQAIWI